MPNPNQEIRFAIETMSDLMFNENAEAFFSFLEKLVSKNFHLDFYLGDEKVTTIKDRDHLENFIRSFHFRK